MTGVLLRKFKVVDNICLPFRLMTAFNPLCGPVHCTEKPWLSEALPFAGKGRERLLSRSNPV
jgi:hypothetical protein